MLETSKLSPEERMRGNREFAKEARKEVVRKGSAKVNMTELRGKLKSMKEMAKVVKMYQEGGEEKMNQYLFDETKSKIRLTKEQLESDPKAREYLKKMFSQDSLGQTLDDFMVSLPTEQDYVENVVEKIKKSSSGSGDETAERLAEIRQMNTPADETAERLAEIRQMGAPTNKTEEAQEQSPSLKIVTSEDAPEVSGEINNGYKFGKRVTNKNVINRATHEAAKIKVARKELIEAARKSAASEVFLKPETREALKRAAAEEEAKFVESSQKFAAKVDKEEERSKNKEVVRAKQTHENRKEFLSKSLIQAYKEKGIKITKDNEADFLVKAPPFSYIFSAKGRKVRDLYDRYVKELK